MNVIYKIESFVMDEKYKRINDTLMKYWDRLKEDGEVPPESLVNPDDIAEIWDDCFLIQVTKTHGYRYDFLGDNLVEAYGGDMVGHEVDSLVSTSTSNAIERFREVIELKRPVVFMGVFVNYSNLKIKYRELLLPFTDGEGEINHILGGVRWRES